MTNIKYEMEPDYKVFHFNEEQLIELLRSGWRLISVLRHMNQDGIMVVLLSRGKGVPYQCHH